MLPGAGPPPGFPSGHMLPPPGPPPGMMLQLPNPMMLAPGYGMMMPPPPGKAVLNCTASHGIG